MASIAHAVFWISFPIVWTGIFSGLLLLMDRAANPELHQPKDKLVCVVCGGDIEPGLARLGSVTCSHHRMETRINFGSV